MNPAAARRGLLRPLAFFALLAFLCTQPAGSRTLGAKAAPTADAADPLLQAMLQELERSKSQLKMENMLTPYYIEYRVAEVDEYAAEAVFGALRQEHRLHLRVLRAVVRVGDYKQDSYFGQGQGHARAPVGIARKLCYWRHVDLPQKSRCFVQFTQENQATRQRVRGASGETGARSKSFHRCRICLARIRFTLAIVPCSALG